nr:Uma2 family endonuclease [Methylobacterium oxalidis]
MRAADFIAWVAARPDEERWNLIEGFRYLMAPQSERHQRIVANLFRHIDTLAERRGCRAVPGLAPLGPTMDDDAPIPDIVMRCGPAVSGGCARDPILVAEVLPSSTISKDRGRETEFFRAIGGYDDAWLKRPLGREGIIELPELDGSVPVDLDDAGIEF